MRTLARDVVLSTRRGCLFVVNSTVMVVATFVLHHSLMVLVLSPFPP